MLRSAFLLFIAIAGPVQASSDELVVARLGERADSGSEPSALDAATGSTQDRRIRILDLRAPGAGLEEIRGRQLPQVLALRPRVVTLFLGSADVCGAMTLRTFARELHVITDFLRRNARKAVISTIALPDGTCARAGPGLRRRVEAFNLTILQTASRNKLLVVDVGVAGNGAPGPLDPMLVAEIEEALVPARSGRAALPSDRGEL